MNSFNQSPTHTHHSTRRDSIHPTKIHSFWQALQHTLKPVFPMMLYCYLSAVWLLKIAQTLTCTCIGNGQPFNAWFYPAFHHAWYSFYWTYHGIIWLAGPYSLLWWTLNMPAYYGYWTFNTYLLLVDAAFTTILIWKVQPFWAIYWSTLSLWFFGAGPDPVDFFIVLFAFIGRWHWYMLPMAIITKLPVGAPLPVWHWVLNSPDSLHGPENYGRYLILGGIWMVSLLGYLKEKM